MSAAQTTNTDPITIYVRLTDEVVRVWRPVYAMKIGNKICQILQHDFDPDIETWEFLPGEIVRVELQTKSGEDVLVAVEKIENAQR